jgi:lipopolysaccharide heptosyltransferase I
MMKEPEKILVVKPSALGDIVHSLPFLNAVRKRFPDAEIHWVAARGLHEMLEGHPMIDRLWIINKGQWKMPSKAGDTLREIMALRSALKEEKFDIAVDLQGLLRSGVIAKFTGAPVRVGFEEAREGSGLFYTMKVKGGRDVHAVDRYLKIASALGCDTDEIKFPFPYFGKCASFNLPEDYIVIAPSAGKEANRWPARRFGELAKMLPYKSLVISGKSDAHLAEETAGASGGRAMSLGGKTTPGELVSIIKGARFFISNDTGPMHIAAALGVPVFAIFGPANPVRTGPYGDIHTVIREDLPCSPCYRRKKCGNWRCMEDITVERVYNIIRERIK